MFSRFQINWEVLFNGLLGLFTICGFCPIKIKEEANKVNVILIVWSLVHLALATILTIISGYAFLDNSNDIDSFNNILKFSIMALTYYVTCIESMMVRKNFVKIWIRVQRVDDLIGSIVPDYRLSLRKFYKQTCRKILVCLLATVIMEVTIITNILELQNWTLMWLLSCIPLAIGRLRHLQHTLYIDLLSHRFRVIKNELKSIVRLTNIDSNTLIVKNFNFYDGLYRRISSIKSVYNMLWETSLFINRSFGLSQLANLLQNFIQLTCDLYLIYSFLYKNNLTYILGNFHFLF